MFTKLRKGWAHCGAFFLAGCVYFSLPYHIPGTFLKEIYHSAIFILIILVGGYLAGTCQNSFQYSKAGSCDQFRFPLNFALTSFIFILALYFFTSYSASIQHNYVQNKTWVTLATFLGTDTIFLAFRYLKNCQVTNPTDETK